MGFAESERDQVGDRVDSNVDYSFQERLALKKFWYFSMPSEKNSGRSLESRFCLVNTFFSPHNSSGLLIIRTNKTHFSPGNKQRNLHQFLLNTHIPFL